MMIYKIILALLCVSNALVTYTLSLNLLDRNAVSEIEFNMSKEELETFKNYYGLSPNSTLTGVRIDEIGTRNNVYYVTGNTIDIFTTNATYTHNGVPGEVPLVLISRVKGDNGTTVTVTRDVNGNVRQMVTTIDRSGAVVEELVAAIPGSPHMISVGDFDEEELQHKFTYANDSLAPSDPRRPETSLMRNSAGSSELASSLLEERVTDTECDSYTRIELAVAYDSTFCEEHGGTQAAADNEVTNIVAATDNRYRQSKGGLCIRVQLSHLEGWCDENSDPYRDMVAAGRSGCMNEDGLLQDFTEYWNTNRRHVHRDTAHLVSGKPLECINGKCVVGCAQPSSTCDVESAYAVIWETFHPNLELRSTVLAHELGHNNGAQHYNEEYNVIMREVITKADSGFSETSIKSMKRYFEKSENSCLDEMNVDSDDDGIENINDKGLLCTIVGFILTTAPRAPGDNSFRNLLKFSPLFILLLICPLSVKACRRREEGGTDSHNDLSQSISSRTSINIDKWRRRFSV